MQSPKVISKNLQAIALAATGATDVLFDCAKDGFEAIHLISRKQYHVIIIRDSADSVDTTLKNMSGIEMVRIAKEIRGDRLGRVVLIGGSTLSEEDTALISKYCHDDVAQPFLGMHFVELLREFL